MPDEMFPKQLGLSSEDIKTPDQRAIEAATVGSEAEVDEGRAEKLEALRNFLRPVLEQRYQEGHMPFDIPRDEVLQRAENRIIPQIERLDLEINTEFLSDMQSVIDSINSAEGSHYTLNSTSLLVITAHLTCAAAGTGDAPDLSEAPFLASEMDRLFNKAHKVSLDEWASQYVEQHKDLNWKTYALEYLNSLPALAIVAKDEGSYRYELNNLVRVLAHDANANGINSLDAETALHILLNNGFIVPSQWKEEFAETWDGKELLKAIENVNSKLLLEDTIDALESYYGNLALDEAKALPLSANDILAAVSMTVNVPGTWEECDEPTQKIISAAMKELAVKLGGKLGKSKGLPVIKI